VCTVTKLKIHSGHILGLAALLFMPMVLLLPKSIAPLFAFSALAVLVIETRRLRRIPVMAGLETYALVAMSLWAFVTWGWSINPTETLKTGFSLAATFFGGVVLATTAAGLSEREKKVFQNGLIMGGVAGFALIAFEFATDVWLTTFLYGLSGKLMFLDITTGRHTNVLKPGLAASALFFWPWAQALWSRFPTSFSALVIVIAIALMFLGKGMAVMIGVSVGAFVFVAALAQPRVVPWTIAGVVVIGILAAPMVPGLFPNPLTEGKKASWFSVSAAHRLIIWRNAVKHIKEKPLLGGGFNSTRSLYGIEDRVEYLYPKEITGNLVTKTFYEPIPLHPHNGVLQVWLELGVVGALILIALLLAIVRSINQRVKDQMGHATSFSLLASGMTIASLSFGIWQSWWLTSLFLGAAFMVSGIEPSGNGGKKSSETVEETGGPKGPEPTRYGDWERKGRAIDF